MLCIPPSQKGEGRLTQKAMDTLQKRYTRAVLGANNVADMRRAILASLHHAMSTDDNPDHQYCPEHSKEKDSWCFYKRMLFDEKERLKKGGKVGDDVSRNPFNHAERTELSLDKELLYPYLKPIYERLTSDALK